MVRGYPLGVAPVTVAVIGFLSLKSASAGAAAKAAASAIAAILMRASSSWPFSSPSSAFLAFFAGRFFAAFRSVRRRFCFACTRGFASGDGNFRIASLNSCTSPSTAAACEA